MSRNQRTAERVQVNLRARWEANFDEREGEVSDISTGGCFVLTAGEVSPMELIELEIELPTGRWLRLWGQVMYYAEEIGFGLRFTGVGEPEQTLLTYLIDHARNGYL